MSMQCPKCDFNGNPHLTETGPHTKATCPQCGAYIKMVGSDELDAIIKASIGEEDRVEAEEEKRELTLVIKTTAPREYMPNVLNRVTLSLQNDYICGEGRVSKPFDDQDYPYEFYYSN